MAVVVAVRRNSDLSEFDRILLWALLQESFSGEFSENDWNHMQGGLHVLVSEGEHLIAHAAAVSRTLVAGGRLLSAGYVEAVATRPKWRNRGLGTAAMGAVRSIILADFELGALSTGIPEFFGRLGWEAWRGPTYAQSPTGRQRTGEADGSVMILRTMRTYDLETVTPLVCESRPGAPW